MTDNLFFKIILGCIFIYVTEVAPSRSSLGATNRLAQTIASTVRAVGPASSTSLYLFSVQHNILGGYGVYAVSALLATVIVCGSLTASVVPRQAQSNLKLKS